jgi:hypothetical protein
MKKIAALFIAPMVALYSNTTINLPIPNSECKIPNEIMTALAMTERSPKKKIGYTYLIRINGKTNSKQAKEKLSKQIKEKKITLLERDKFGDVYDCQNEKNCSEATRTLIKNGIKNIDLGAYQTNYRYHPSKIEHYFKFETSYMLACKYQHELVNQYGWSWQTVAKYHSKTKEHNERYQKLLIANYKKVIGWNK